MPTLIVKPVPTLTPVPPVNLNNYYIKDFVLIPVQADIILITKPVKLVEKVIPVKLVLMETNVQLVQST